MQVASPLLGACTTAEPLTFFPDNALHAGFTTQRREAHDWPNQEEKKLKLDEMKGQLLTNNCAC